MRRLLWVEDEFFDTALHAHRARAMAAALGRRDVRVGAVCSYEIAPVPLPEFDRVRWCEPCGPGLARNLRFLAQAWMMVLAEWRVERPDWIVLCKRTAPCALPVDLLGRAGLTHTRSVLDLRTLEYGSDEAARRGKDAALRVATRAALAYSGVAHSGATAITPSLAAEVARLSGRRNVGVWGSGFTPGPDADAAQPEPDAVLASLAPAAAAALDDLRAAAKGRVVALYHGTLSPHRGLQEMVAAMKYAQEAAPELLLVMVGDGPLAPDLEQQRVRSGVEGTVLLHDAVPHEAVRRLLALADLAVVPYPGSEYWRFNHPIKVVECLGAGLPVVAAYGSALPEVFPGCGAIVSAPAPGAEALGAALARLARDPGERARLAADARVCAADLTWDAQAGRLLSYLEGLGGPANRERARRDDST